MKAICVVKCQKDRKHVFEVGKKYEVTEDMLKSGFFKKVEAEKHKDK